MADISSITLPGGGTYDLKDKNAYSAQNKPSASNVTYSGADARMSSTNVQDAIDELVSEKADIGDLPFPAGANELPIMDGTAYQGSGSDYSRWDHVHPSDTSKANQAQLATVESGSTASRAYSVGEYFCLNGLLYRVTDAISSGGTFTPGTNCESTAVGDFLYNHEYPNEQWFTLRAGQKLTIHIGGTTAASGLSNLLMAFSSNVSTLNGGLAYLKIIDYRLNMHSLNFLFGALPTNIAMGDAVGEMTFTNTTTANAVCQINVIMLGSLSKNITFSVT